MKKSLLMTQADSSTPTDPFGDGSGTNYFRFDSMTSGTTYNDLGNDTISNSSGTISTSIKKYGAASLDLTSNIWYRNSEIPSTFRHTYNDDRTITFWVRVNSAQNGSPINFSWGIDSRSSFNITSSNVTQLTYYNGGSYRTVHGATLTNGVWYFIACRLDGQGYPNHSTLQLTVNSTNYTSMVTTGSIGAWIERGIGRDANAGYFNGYLDHLRSFNRILTDAEISYIYNNDPL